MSSLWRHLKATPAMFRVSLADTVAYRAELAIWVLTATLPLVMLALWETIAAGAPIAGMTKIEVSRYFAAALIVRQLTGAWIVWEMNFEIRNGSLSAKLLKPLHPIWVWAVWTVSAMPFRMIVLTPLIALLAWARPELLTLPAAPDLALFAVSVTLALALAFLVQTAFGSLAFFMDRSIGMFSLWFGLWSFLSGYIAPTAFFPSWAQNILYYLPFRATLSIPVEILSGRLHGGLAWQEIGIQCVWVCVFGIIARTLWNTGVARYEAFGS